MAYRIMAIPTTLSDLQDYSPTANPCHMIFHTAVQQVTRFPLI